MGVTLVGHFLGADESGARFAPDLTETMAWGDARHGDLMQLFHKTAERLGLPDPQVPEPSTFDGLAPDMVRLDGFGAVIFAGGYRPDYNSWLPWPAALDELGFPIQTDGVSSVVDDLYFIGVPFLRNRKSSLLIGVGDDATVIADTIAGRVAKA
jgi:putative flavoprotein involved in K+ transport